VALIAGSCSTRTANGVRDDGAEMLIAPLGRDGDVRKTGSFPADTEVPYPIFHIVDQRSNNWKFDD
jgi:hypothetical protein